MCVRVDCISIKVVSIMGVGRPGVEFFENSIYEVKIIL